MSAPAGLDLDLQVIAELLAPEDLGPPSSTQAKQKHPINIEDTNKTSQEPDHPDMQSYTNQITATPSIYRDIQQDGDDSIIPGLGQSDMLTSSVVDAPVSVVSDVPIEGATLSSSGNLGEGTLNTILARHNIQMVTSDSSDEEEDNDTSEESDGSTPEDESDDSSASDSEATSSEAGIELPREDDERSSTGTTSPEAQHRRNKAKLDKMVEEEASSDDSLDLRKSTQPSSMFATAHEIVAPQVTMPPITEVPDGEPIELIGEVMSIVDSVVVIKSSENGMQRVLDTDSLLVFKNRKVLGLVFETFGPLTTPLYSVRFPSSAHFPPAISAFAESPNERLKVYHCPSHSTFAYTSQLLLNRGNDASNIYDEEVAENEIEFSDDEAERDWKRKQEKARRGAKRKRKTGSRAGSTYEPSPRLGGSSELPYDDDMDVAKAVEETTLSYVDPYEDEATSPTDQLPSDSNGRSVVHSGLLPSLKSAAQLPARPSNHGSRDRGRGRGRGQGKFSGGRGRGGIQPGMGHMRPLPPGRFPTTGMQPPGMTGYNSQEYNPSFSGGVHPSMPLHQNGAPFYGPPYMGGVDPRVPLIETRSVLAFGFQNGLMNTGNDLYGNGLRTHDVGRVPAIPPVAGGPAPGAYINPRFAMMQFLPHDGSGSQNPGQHQNDQDFNSSGHNAPW